jgi:hypothetical protein
VVWHLLWEQEKRRFDSGYLDSGQAGLGQARLAEAAQG